MKIGSRVEITAGYYHKCRGLVVRKYQSGKYVVCLDTDNRGSAIDETYIAHEIELILVTK